MLWPVRSLQVSVHWCVDLLVSFEVSSLDEARDENDNRQVHIVFGTETPVRVRVKSIY